MGHQGRQHAVLAVVRNLGDGCRDAELHLGKGCSGPLRACVHQNLCYLCMLCLGQRRAGVEGLICCSCLLGTILVLQLLFLFARIGFPLQLPVSLKLTSNHSGNRLEQTKATITKPKSSPEVPTRPSRA